MAKPGPGLPTLPPPLRTTQPLGAPGVRAEGGSTVPGPEGLAGSPGTATTSGLCGDRTSVQNRKWPPAIGLVVRGWHQGPGSRSGLGCGPPLWPSSQFLSASPSPVSPGLGQGGRWARIPPLIQPQLTAQKAQMTARGSHAPAASPLHRGGRARPGSWRHKWPERFPYFTDASPAYRLRGPQAQGPCLPHVCAPPAPHSPESSTK